ncbi:MAG: transglycosylase domain-containing protein [Candidatus Paracaedibacteraceae bacterium]|nr:transglycosylase domain-containing protein [Candidatus Paracaedibacteraceae bacterium]
MKIYPGSPQHSRDNKKETEQLARPLKAKRPTKSKNPRKSFFLRFMGKMVYGLFMVGIWGSILLTLGILWFSQDLPDLGALSVQTRKPSVTVQTHDGTILGTYGDLYEDMIPVADLPAYVPQAIMAVEDRRFEYHFGVDVIGLIRAAYTNYKAQRVVQGGSTLTQQLSKNILQTHGLFSVKDRSMKRKIQEVLLSLWLEWKFTKQQIMTMYLNRVYLGSATYGIDAAARMYFNKSARSLTVFEAAIIAGLLKAPSNYTPSKNPKRSIERATVVLRLMQEAGYIKEYEDHLKQGEVDLANIQLTQGKGGKYFADWIYDTIPSIIGPITKDIVVITTLDTDMQRHAEMVAKYYNETMGKELNASQVSFIAMSPDGAVKALVGGRNYAESQFNRAVQAVRQPGSAFKTFVYLAAMESGMTPETLIDDSPYNGGKWRPSNFKHTSLGQVTLRTGFMKSVNSVSIRLAEKVTPLRVAETAQRLGISRPLPNELSIALGAGETTLLELTTAHATFCNQGYAVWPHGVMEVRDKEGNILYQHTEVTRQRIIAATPLAYMRDLLRANVESGSGRASNIDSTVAGKTGSNGDKDAFFLGYRDEYGTSTTGYTNIVFGAWVGNDSGAAMAKISTGGKIPTRICADFLKGPNTHLTNNTATTHTSRSLAIQNTQTAPQKNLPTTSTKSEKTATRSAMQPKTLDDLFQ